MQIRWTDYLRYRADLRGFDLREIELILKYGDERYLDQFTGKRIAIGKHRKQLVVIPYEIEHDILIPITIHATTRQQIHNRIKKQRYTYA